MCRKMRNFAGFFAQWQVGLHRPFQRGDFREWSTEPCGSSVAGGDTHAPKEQCIMRNGQIIK